MKSLIEELKNNFKVLKIEDGGFTEIEVDGVKPEKIVTDCFDTYDKAVDAIIKSLTDRGEEAILLPFVPVPYIIDNRGESFQGVLNFYSIKE